MPWKTFQERRVKHLPCAPKFISYWNSLRCGRCRSRLSVLNWKMQLLPTERPTAKPAQRGQEERYRGQILSEWWRDWAWGWLSGIPGKQAPNEIFNFVVSKVKKRERDSLSSPFPASVQLSGASRHKRGPGMQLLTSEAYLPSTKSGSNQTDVWTIYHKSHFGAALLLP